MRQTSPFTAAQNVRKPIGSHICELPFLGIFLQGQTNTGTSASVHSVTGSQEKRSHKRESGRSGEEGKGGKMRRERYRRKEKSLCSAFPQFYCINPAPN